jgi:hypothetical protein
MVWNDLQYVRARLNNQSLTNNSIAICLAWIITRNSFLSSKRIPLFFSLQIKPADSREWLLAESSQASLLIILKRRLARSISYLMWKSLVQMTILLVVVETTWLGETEVFWKFFERYNAIRMLPTQHSPNRTLKIITIDQSGSRQESFSRSKKEVFRKEHEVPRPSSSFLSRRTHAQSLLPRRGCIFSTKTDQIIAHPKAFVKTLLRRISEKDAGNVYFSFYFLKSAAKHN